MSYVDEIKQRVAEQNPSQPEFNQAVEEVLVVALSGPVALLGGIACGVGDELSASGSYSFGGDIVGALRCERERGKERKECKKRLSHCVRKKVVGLVSQFG